MKPVYSLMRLINPAVIQRLQDLCIVDPPKVIKWTALLLRYMGSLPVFFFFNTATCIWVH